MSLLGDFKHLLIPRESNNQKASLLHPASLSILVAFFLVWQFGLNYFALISPSVLGFASNITPEQVIELTNQRRLENGLSPLKNSLLLNEVAQRKAGDMFAFDYWAHNSPSGREPWAFFQEAGYQYLYAGENLARDFLDSDSVVSAWMNSPSHKENILNDHYQEIGLAVVNGTLNGVETTLVVQAFGTPTPEPRAQTTPSLGEASSAVSKPQPALVGKALAQTETGQQTATIASPFSVTKTLAIFLLGLIFGLLIIDAFLVYKKGIIRLSGRNLAHLIFIGFLLLAIFLTTQGVIL